MKQSPATELAYATGVTALAVAVAWLCERLIGLTQLSLVFITAAIFVAVRTRMWVAVVAAILGFLAYNFFFLEPRYSFFLVSAQSVGTVLMFLVAALICGRLANRLRSQVLALRAEQSRGDALRIQAENERLRASLLASVSHDLRSPLAAIVGSAESLCLYRDKLSDADQAALATSILDEGQRLDRYIQNLLDLTRIGQGGMKLDRGWVALGEIVGAVLPRLRKQYPSAQLQLDLPKSLPLLNVHSALIEQALFNVLDNALKFSPPGQPVAMWARREGDWIEIDVRDLGPGIAENDAMRVFEMFYSGGRSDHGDAGKTGTGMGLTISQGMVEAHGGSIRVLPNTDAGGTTMRIRLPVTPPPAQPPAED